MSKLIDITGKALSGEWGTDDETGNGIPVLRTTNFTNEGIVDYSNVVTRTITKKNIDEKYLKPGDIIIEKSGGSDKYPVGRVVFFDGPKDKYLFNNFTGLLRVRNTDKWYPRYVFYSLFGNYKKGGTKQFENKTTGLHNLKTDDYVARYEVPDMIYERQVLICNLLDKLLCTISKRKEQLQKLDYLIKARFVEMFGNPFDVKTKVKWPIKTICDLSESIMDGSNVDKALYKQNGDVLFLRIQNVWCNEFKLEDSVYISEIENEEYKDTSLKHGDLLITKIGRYYTSDSSLGRVSVYLGDDDKANYSNNIMRIRFKEGINSEFINTLMNLDDYNKFIRRTSVGGTDKRALSKGLISSYPIIVPPSDKQNEFVDFLHQVDKSKFSVMKGNALFM